MRPRRSPAGKPSSLASPPDLADDPQQRLDERRLARAVAAEEAKDLAPLDAQADALQGLLPLAAEQPLDISLAQIASFDCRLIGHGGVLKDGVWGWMRAR